MGLNGQLEDISLEPPDHIIKGLLHVYPITIQKNNKILFQFKIDQIDQ